MSDEETLRRHHRGKRQAQHFEESSSESESDDAVEPVIKRKMNVIESDSSSSSGSSIVGERISRPTKKRPRITSDNESSSEENSDEKSEDSSSEESDENIAFGNRGRVRWVESDDESTSEDSDSEESSSESGHNSSGSYESCDNTDEETMVQAAIQESLAFAGITPSESKDETTSKNTESKVIAVPENNGFESDGSDGQSEKCPICLLSFTDQEIGSPETCDHSFCSMCIQEWAKNVNTCPVDRQVFSLIFVRKQLNGKVIKKIPIITHEARDPQESDSDPTSCEVCGRSDREDRLLLCDGCDLGYHLECLNPPMENVPIEEWFCPDCAADQPSRMAEEIEMQDGELFDLFDDTVQIRPRTSRLLPRTRQSERVRATLRSLHQDRLQRAHVSALQQPSTSGIESVGADSSSVASGARATSVASASAVRRRKVVRRKTIKSRRKKRTTKRTTKRKPVRRRKKVVKKTVKGSDEDVGEESDEIEEYVPKTKRRKRRKRKIRRRKKVYRRKIRKPARTAVARTVKGRLAEQLGLCAPRRPGLSLPVVRSRATTSDIDLQRSRAGIPTLHIYGQQNELEYFSSDDEDVMEGGGLAVAPRSRIAHAGTARLLARKKLSVAALQSHTAIRTPKPVRNNVNVGANKAASSSPVDLIGSILDSQSIWHSKTSSVTIKPDGSLEVNKDHGGPSVANTQGTVVCDSVSNKNKTNGDLIRSDNRLSDVIGQGTSSVDIGSASERTSQAPMYPGRGDNGNRPPPSSGFHQFGGNRYSAPSYSSYQDGREFSNYSSSGSNFDASSTRAGYSNYLNSGLPPAPLRNTPVRFRVTPRYPLRRPQGPQRPQDSSSKHEDKKCDESGEGSQKPLEEEEDDEIDIYSDIEAGGGGSGGPSGGGSEQDEGERSMETSYEALPPPPEPSALLMGFGEQALSEEEPTSDSELVIDDNVGLTSPHDQNESGPQIPESEKYDPAEPLADSDDDDDDDDDEVSVPVSNKESDADIPLPPCLPSLPFTSSTNITQHIINSSSNSNTSYLHSPTYGETSFETEKLSSVTDDGVVSKVVKEVISERLKGSSGIIGVNLTHASPTHPSLNREDDDEDECPNFSIYSAASMDIARRTVEETADIDTKGEDENNCQPLEHELEEAKEIEKLEDIQSEKTDSESEVTKPVPEIASSVINLVIAAPDSQDVKSKDKKEQNESEAEDQEVKKIDIKGKDEEEDREKKEDNIDGDINEIDANDRNIEHPPGHKDDSDSNSSIEDLTSEKHVSDSEEKDGLENCDDSKVGEYDIQHKEAMESDKNSSSNEREEKVVKICVSKSVVDDTYDSDDNVSLNGKTLSPVAVVGVENDNPLPAPSGLEGLDTETISETEEAINFDDVSQDGNELASAEEDGEISFPKKKKKRKNRRTMDADGKITSDFSNDLMAERELTPPEEGEIIDDRPKTLDTSKRDKKSVERKKDASSHEMEKSKISDENYDVSKVNDDEKKKKKKEKRKSSEKVEDRPVLGSSENKRKSKEKTRRSDDANISWKKPSKSTKERNYRDTKTTKSDDTAKEKDNENKDASVKKKKKEKRKDMERYDVRKIVSDKRRRRKDEFGRDLSRDRSYSKSRSRSRSHRRSRSLSKSRRHRSPVRTRRSRSRSRYRSRSRSYRRSRSKSKNRSKRRSKDKNRRSRSKDRSRARMSRSRSRGGRRSRSRSGSHSRSKNKNRLRSRSRSPVKQRKERVDRSHVVREVQRFHARRSWSRTWTPSWSRSRSHSISCSSFTQSRSPSVRHFNRSFSRSFSRSWSRERYERIPLEKTGALSNKAPKKLTVIVSNTKENSDRQKKEKKKKKDKKKEGLGNAEKRKKRKEKSPAPSKEVFTSGDNILVSVNFNKSSKTASNKDIAAALPILTKDSSKRKREETFETEREIGKKIRKEKNKDKTKGVPNEKTVVGLQAEKKGKKQIARNKSARIAALLKQKPVAIIDLDQSPFREQTPSPRDLIVLSDSDEDVRDKGAEHEEIAEALSVCRSMRPDIASPQSPVKGVHNVTANISVARTPESDLKLLSAVSNYLITSTGPKTPPEPQIKFSIAAKQPQLRSINNPLQEDDDLLPEDTGLDDSDQRIEEELDRSLGDIVHKGPNTPPEPRGPTTPCSPPTSPDVYDPFDPTKSGTPSPAGPEASMDGPPSPSRTPADEMQLGNVGGSGGRDSPLPSDLEDMVNKNAEARNKSPPMQPTEEVAEEVRSSPKVVARETISPVGMSETIALTPQLQNDELPPVTELSEVSKGSHGLPSNITSVSISEGNAKSPERKIGVVLTAQQTKLQSTPIKAPVFPVPSLKQIPTSQQSMTSTPSHGAPPPIFPSLTPVNIASMLCTPTANLALSRTNLFTPPTPMVVPSLLQHVSNAGTPVQTRLPVDKTVVSAVPIRSLVQNGEQLTKPQDISTEVVDMDLDSPYSPGSSEGDDLFDPPADTPTRSNQPVHSTERPKAGQAGVKNAKLAVPVANLPHKSPSKSQDKFDSLFGMGSVPAKAPGSAPAKTGRSKGHKGAKTKTKHMKGGKKEIAIKMDEDQLQILDELPSSAVELQVKDKFLKKLNRQERVVEEVKLSLKPHYNRKHITKEEYKDILRKSVPKICHNKSGEINPVKIATLVEAYVKKVRYEKKKIANTSSGTNPTPAKAKVAKATKWS